MTTETYTEFSGQQLGETMGAVLDGVEAGLAQTLTSRAGNHSHGRGSRG